MVNSDQALLSIVALCYLFCIKKLPSNPVNTDTEGAIESVHSNGMSGGGVQTPLTRTLTGAIESVHINGVSGGVQTPLTRTLREP